MAPLPPGSTIGVIGGGQLGRMLAMAAARLSYRTTVLEPQADCPAAQVANRQIVAAYDDETALADLARAASVVTYEFENVPVRAATWLAERVPVYPPPKALEVSQDRATEKRFMERIGVAVAPFAVIDSQGDLDAWREASPTDCILKTRRMGYDGKGQVSLAKGADVAGLFDRMGGVPLIMEEKIAFTRELSVIVARAADGSSAAYDPAVNVHRDGILHTSTVSGGMSEAVKAQARKIAAHIAGELDYVGVLGVEFFEEKGGGLRVNEIAPRVHNSGHWTEAACAVSQFEQHIRAVVGLPLGAPDRHSDCVMENLIGDDVGRVPALLAEPDVVVHIYGKAEARPGRKMGHFTRIRPKGSAPAG